MMEIGGEAAAATGAGAHDGQPANLNISDVIEAISQADPSFNGVALEGGMYRVSVPAATAHGSTPSPTPTLTPQAPTPSAAPVSLVMSPADRPHAVVRILEQPASKALRFRYECEGRSAGSIPGVNSTSERKTYPTIQISGYKGNAIVVVSCVNKDPENRKYRPHPHNLVGRERCKNGVCTVEVSGEDPVVAFSNLGIQCVKRRDIAEALRLREEIRVDPFKTGFSHKTQPQSIELNAVRLCFQVFLRDRSGKITFALTPVVSEVIYDKKAMSELNIARVSHCAGPATGGTELILLCEKVNREDIAVMFYETSEDNRVVWETPANILLVYKQVAIVITTPPYDKPDTEKHHTVQIQLKRLVDDTRSAPCPFVYTPSYPDAIGKKRKAISPYVESFCEQDRSWVEKQEIKVEPKADKTPPHAMSSPPQQFPQYQDINYQMWAKKIEDMQQGLSTAPGSTHMNPYASPDMSWRAPEYAQPVSPSLGMSPNMQPRMSPMHDMSPVMPVVMSPNYTPMSPEIQTLPSGMKMANLQTMPPNMAMSSNLRTLSPMAQGMSMQGGLSPNPNVSHLSPAMGQVSPSLGHVSPNMSHVSPNVVNLDGMPRQNLLQQLPPMSMDTANNDSPSFSGLLNSIDRGEIAQLNSGELSGLVSMLQDNPDLSDSLNRLSTRDLLQHTDLP